MGCLHLKSSFKCLLDPFLYIYFDVSKIYKYSQSKIKVVFDKHTNFKFISTCLSFVI